MDPHIFHEVGQALILQYIETFKALNKIVDSCFKIKTDETKKLDALLTEFRKGLLAINVSETLKIHVLLEHLEQCLNFLGENEGLGLWSEQAGEAIHREFLIFWNRRKVKSMENPFYIIRLKKAVVQFSSDHI